MSIYRRTKSGIAICPFFTWTLECIGGEEHSENDVSLTYCVHPKNPDLCGGNCSKKHCPILESTVSIGFWWAPSPCLVEPLGGEFTKGIRDGLNDGAKFVSPQLMREACDRLDAQQQEIEAGKNLWVDAQSARKRLAKEVDRLTTMLMAQAERIEELERIFDGYSSRGN